MLLRLKELCNLTDNWRRENTFSLTNDGKETLSDLLKGSSITQVPVKTIVGAAGTDGVTYPIRRVSPLTSPTTQWTLIVFTNATHDGLEHS